jgi:hypothetical protein
MSIIGSPSGYLRRKRSRLVRRLIEESRLSIMRASHLCLPAQSLAYYKAHGRDDRAVRLRIKEIVATRVRYGITRAHLLLKIIKPGASSGSNTSLNCPSLLTTFRTFPETSSRETRANDN